MEGADPILQKAKRLFLEQSLHNLMEMILEQSVINYYLTGCPFIGACQSPKEKYTDPLIALEPIRVLRFHGGSPPC